MVAVTSHPSSWLRVTPKGLYCAPGDLYIDPVRPVDGAVITHGHGDHARPGNKRVLATNETLDIMRVRYGDTAAREMQSVAYGEEIRIGDVGIRLVPAGHELGSAQVILDHRGSRAIVSGDYKRRRDPTCAPFEPVSCDVFITEATFGLPVFRHPDDGGEIAKLIASLELFPERAHLVGVYALGKCQRVIRLIREAGYDRPLYIHGALTALSDLYVTHGIELGELRPTTDVDREALAGEIVLAPPSAFADRWSRRLPDPLVVLASGWMRVRQRAKQRGVELPLIISDHADWDELIQTLDDVGAGEVWVTHGSEEALVHAAKARGIDARALNMVGYDVEEA